MALPPEVMRMVARIAQPKTSRDMRSTSPFCSQFITPDDIFEADCTYALRHWDRHFLRTNMKKVDTKLAEWWLAYAAWLGDYTLLVSLVNAGINAQGHNSIALQWAASYGQERAVKLLLKVGRPSQEARDHALMVAAKRGQYTTTKQLLKAGANVHAYNDFALIAAAQFNHHHVIHLLLRNEPRRVSPRALEKSLTHAASQGRYEIVNCLLDAAQNTDGSTCFTDADARIIQWAYLARSRLENPDYFIKMSKPTSFNRRRRPENRDFLIKEMLAPTSFHHHRPVKFAIDPWM
ncbi:hypothetical protein HDV00_004642 [Rhizophlyctis rosea]|nr:hypothetical protein HDV00_004642 [Rhizophlyctis rosea]